MTGLKTFTSRREGIELEWEGVGVGRGGKRQSLRGINMFGGNPLQVPGIGTQLTPWGTTPWGLVN
jgi:hypothetical protein